MTSKFGRDGFSALPVEAIRNRRSTAGSEARPRPAGQSGRRPELLYFFEG